VNKGKKRKGQGCYAPAHPVRCYLKMRFVRWAVPFFNAITMLWPEYTWVWADKVLDPPFWER
jgi:hypothetical protein